MSFFLILCVLTKFTEINCKKSPIKPIKKLHETFVKQKTVQFCKMMGFMYIIRGKYYKKKITIL